MSNTYIAGERTKTNILQESKKLFYNNGYTNTTYSEISSAAKINRALIPYHFKNKQALGLDIYHEIMKNFFELIDNLLDTSQFDSDFVSILHIVTYYRLLSDNVPFLRFIKELQADEETPLYTAEEELHWITCLGDKFNTLDKEELSILTQMHIGAKKESIHLFHNDVCSSPDTISHAHIRMLMCYVGYSAETIDELYNAAVEVANLLKFKIKNDFTIELKYK